MRNLTKIIILLTIMLLTLAAGSVYAEKNRTLDSLLNKLKTEKVDTAKVMLLLEIAKSYKNNYAKSIEYAEKALKLSEKIKYIRGIVYAKNGLGVIYFTKNEYDKAIYFWQNSLLNSKGINDKNTTAKIFFNLGRVYEQKSDYVNALNNFISSIKLYEETRNNRKIALISLEIGTIYRKSNNYKKAIGFYEKAKQISEKINFYEGITLSLNELGVYYHEKKNNEIALKYFNDALEAAKKTDRTDATVCPLGNIAEIYLDNKDYSKALLCFKKVLQEFINMEDKEKIALTYINMANLFIEMKKINGAIIYVNKSQEIALKNNFKEIIKNNYEIFYKIYKETKQYKRALEYTELFMQMKDSILNETMTKQITEMETKYQSEKKDKEITLLNKDKELKESEIKQQKQLRNSIIAGFILITLIVIVGYNRYRIKQKLKHEKQIVELEQKALRMQMNPHFIFNALNSISGFITQKDEVSAKNYLSKFAKLMRQTLENSRESFISVQQEVEALQYYLDLEQLRFSDKFDYVITIDPKINKETMVIPSLLIQPIVENAILHGIVPKETKGKIDISFEIKENDKIICKIEDDGVGRSCEGKEKNVSHKSIGMEVTEERLKIINQAGRKEMQLEIIDVKDDSDKPAGTRIKFNIPVLMA